MAQAPTTKARRDALREGLKKKIEEGPRPPRLSQIDGIEISVEDEAALNEVFAMCFRGARGKQAIEYLASITINRIAGAGVEPNTLLHLEGSRYLYGVILARVELGRERK